MLTGAKRTGFLPVLHTDKGHAARGTSEGGSRRSRITSPAKRSSAGSGGGASQRSRNSGLIGSSSSNTTTSSNRGLRWGRRLPLFRFFQRVRNGASTWRYCMLLLFLALCVIIQLFIFLQISRNARSYLASTSILKGFFISQPDIPVRKLDSLSVEVLTKEYDSAAKALPYVGNSVYMETLQPHSRGWYNSLAVFPFSTDEAMHGRLGIRSTGEPLWVPAAMPDPIDAATVNKTEELKNGGGFYLKLSDALPLDRHPPDNRDPMCLGVKYDLQSLSDSLDTSIVITFHNEPMSTLLRSVHSILNYTPPPLVREILLVDDVSNSTALLPGNELDEYIPFLPKVKLIRMEERNGIVPARMRGIRAASAPVVVILDSHIEVNDGWLEPQLARIQEAPKSFVFPQTLSISSTHFNHHKEAGIGCFVSFDWNVQEKSQVAGFWGSTDAIPSPMHGGGLVAFRKDTFYEIGGYDEGFSMWGAENVELSFRIWMCGARLECAPCAAVYHIFRSGGSGYSLPPGSVWKNRIRTAKLWMDEYFPLAAAFNSYHLSHTEPELPDMTKMLELKKRLKCKDMNWFMKNVDPKHEFQDLSTALAGLGDIKSVYKPSLCLDSLGETDVGNSIGLYQCHGQLGNQGFLLNAEAHQLRLMGIGKTTRSRLCLRPPGVLERCTNDSLVGHMAFDVDKGIIRWTGKDEYENYCLAVQETDNQEKVELIWQPCSEDNINPQQQWQWPRYPAHQYSPRQLTDGFVEYTMLEKQRNLATVLRNQQQPNFCLDSLQQRYAGSPISVFWCHGGLGTQGFTFIPEKGLLLAQARGSDGQSLLCVGPPGSLFPCTDTSKTRGISFTSEGKIEWRKPQDQLPAAAPEQQQQQQQQQQEQQEQGEEQQQQQGEEKQQQGEEQQKEQQQQQQEQQQQEQRQGEQQQQQQQEQKEEEAPLCLTLISSPNTPISKRTAVFQPCREGDEAQKWQQHSPSASS